MPRKALYDRRKADGRCVQCGTKHNMTEGHVRCAGCAYVHRLYTNSANRRRHIDKGLCVYCNNKAREGRVYCWDCTFKSKLVTGKRLSEKVFDEVLETGKQNIKNKNLSVTQLRR